MPSVGTTDPHDATGPDVRDGRSSSHWGPRWGPGLVLSAVGAAFASVAGFLPIVLAVTAVVVVAASLRIWEVERLPRPPLRWAPSPSSLVVAAIVTTGVGLTQLLGVIGGLLALIAIVVFLVAIGAHGG